MIAILVAVIVAIVVLYAIKCDATYPDDEHPPRDSVL